MPAISATTVQKTYKEDVVTLYGRASIGAAGAPTLIKTDGASKGIKSITLGGSNIYTITLDDEIALKQFIGCPVLNYSFNSAAANSIVNFRVHVESVSAKTLAIIGYSDAGSTSGTAVIPNAGVLMFSITISTSTI